jgi:hypothetical protein
MRAVAKKNAYKILARKVKGERPLRSLWHRLDESIKTDQKDNKMEKCKLD